MKSSSHTIIQLCFRRKLMSSIIKLPATCIQQDQYMALLFEVHSSHWPEPKTLQSFNHFLNSYHKDLNIFSSWSQFFSLSFFPQLQLLFLWVFRGVLFYYMHMCHMDVSVFVLLHEVLTESRDPLELEL